MKSILHNEMCCYVCGTTNWLEEHHIFGGPNRKLSEKYGLKVFLCKRHHAEAHSDLYFRRTLQALAQQEWENEYGSRNDFMALFGRNYIEGYTDTDDAPNEQIEAITQA